MGHSSQTGICDALARFSGGMFASASDGIGLPAIRVVMLICHAPGLALGFGVEGGEKGLQREG